MATMRSGGGMCRAGSWLALGLVLMSTSSLLATACESDAQCQHGGTCEHIKCTGKGSCGGASPSCDGTCAGTCSCSSGYSGPTCSHSTGCDGNPCNHGKCTPNGGSHTCDCSGSGYSGSACDHPTGCDGDPCKNGGTCKANGGSHTCECSSGYSGSACENPTGCDGDPCQNVDPGKCTANGGSHTCDCSGSGYKGQNCETGIPCNTAALPSSPTGPATWTNQGKYPSRATFSDTCGKKKKLVGPTSWTCGKDGQYSPDQGDPTNPLQCKSCPNIPHCNDIDCKSCKSWQWGTCRSVCNDCATGYPATGNKQQCEPRRCQPLSLSNGHIVFTVNGQPQDSPVFSGSPGQEKTEAKMHCDKGYQLSYDRLNTAAQKDTKCRADGQWSGMDTKPFCMRTCEPDRDEAVPCVATGGTNHYSACDGGDAKKFLCRCKLGWQGERCETDINECIESGYADGCVESIAQRTQTTAYSLQAELLCSEPYWMSSGKPSRCDRDSVGNLLTQCDNLLGSWTCGACIVAGDDPTLSCCDATADFQMALPVHPAAPWHYPDHPSPVYTQCDTEDHGGGASQPCTPTNYHSGGACTGPPSASQSTMSVANSSDCIATAGKCTCKACNLTGFPSGSTQCSPVWDDRQSTNSLTISIDPYDQVGRKTAQNGVTTSKSFNITINRLDTTAWHSTAAKSKIAEDRPTCESPPITWAGATYTASLKCNIAGRYEIRVSPVIGPDAHDLVGSTIITLVPQRADPSTTLAFLANQKADWCTGEPGKAPRCRTKKDQGNQVLVVVRDPFGNPRPGTSAAGAADYVTWKTTENETGRIINSTTHAEWDEQQHAYVADFTFTEKFAFVFVLHLAVNEQQWSNIPSESTGVWQYNLPKDAEGKPLAVLWSSTVFKYRFYTSLNSQNCKDLQCGDAYLNPIAFYKNATALASCRFAGCLFHAGLDAGDVNTFHVLADWAVTGDSVRPPEISVSIERLCELEMEGSLYWQKPTVCNADRTWNYTKDDDDTIDFNPPPTWPHGSQLYNGSVRLHVKHPGLFRVKATATFALGSPDTADMIVSVGPGPVSPTHTELHMIYSDPKQSFGAVRSSEDWNGDAGFASLGSEGDQEGSRYVPQIRLTVYANDKDMNPRIGRDEVVIKLYRPSKNPANQRLLEKSFEYQAHVSDDQTVKSLMAKCGDNGDCRYWMTNGNSNIKDGLCGADCDQPGGDRFFLGAGTLGNGKYSLRTPYSFKQFGVYQLSAWICGGDNFIDCQKPEDDRARVLRLITAPGASLLNFTGKPTRTYNFTVCPQNTEIPSDEHTHDNTFDDNTKDPDYKASRGAILGPHLEYCKCKKGFTGNVPQGVICYACEKGKYQNHAGVGACTDCAAGTRCGCSINENMIHVEASQCRAQADWSPACSECESCAAGRYQNQRGQEDCNTCQTKTGSSNGFWCPKGSAHPMAKAGYWVSSHFTASKEVQMLKCMPMAEHMDTQIVSESIAPIATSNDPLVKLHGTAWCPGSPLSGWTRVAGTDKYKRDENCDADCDRESIPAEDLQKWETSWNPGQASVLSWDALPPHQQEDCYKKYHEIGFNLGDACLQVVGSRCRTGHKTVQSDRPCAVCCGKGETGGPGSKYPDCDGNEWYMAAGVSLWPPKVGKQAWYCHKCPTHSALSTTTWIYGSLVTIIVVGVLMKYGLDLAHKFRALKPPMMTIITFMQVVDLFRKHTKTNDETGTAMRWPDLWGSLLGFLSNIGTLFNLGIPQWASELMPQVQSLFSDLNPQCLFVLPYWQKWMLWMLSPLLLLVATFFYYYLRVLLAKSAVHMRDILELHQEFCEECQKEFNDWQLDGSEDSDDDLEAEAHAELDSLPVANQAGVTRPASPSTASRAASPVRGAPGIRTLHIGADSLGLEDRVRGGGGVGSAGTESGTREPLATSSIRRLVPAGRASQWVHATRTDPQGHPITRESEPDLPETAKWRLRVRNANDDGHCRWCEKHALEYAQKNVKKLKEDLEDPQDMPLPSVCSCLEGERLCFCLCPARCPYCHTAIPIVIAMGVAIPTILFLGWIVGTLLFRCDPDDDECNASSLLWPVPSGGKLSEHGPLYSILGVALNGTKLLLLPPVGWALIWKSIVRSPTRVGDPYRLRTWVAGDCQKLGCNYRGLPWIGEHCRTKFEESSLSNQAGANSKWAPLQVLNRLVLQPLSRNNQKDHWQRAISLWHFYLWFGYINIIGTAIEPLACQRNDYGRYFMSAHGAESIECNWCTGDRDLKHAFPSLLRDGAGEVFAAKNFFGLFGLFGLFTFIPLQDYPLFASMSMFCTVFYFAGIPAYFLTRLMLNHDKIKTRNFEYAFLTDKMREDCYHWEVAIIVRKGLLAVFSTLSAGSPITMGLSNLVVMGAASFCHFKLRPYAHADINRVEDLSLISTNMVLLVGLGGLAVGGAGSLTVDQQDDRSALKLFNFVAMCVLVVHFLHTVHVMLNRLSQSVWQLRETGGCGCGQAGAAVLGALLGVITAVSSTFFFYQTEIDWAFPLPSIRFKCPSNDMECLEGAFPSGAHNLALVLLVVFVVLFGFLCYYLAEHLWCRCCNRRGRTLCCYGCHAGCGLCGNCTLPCYYPCCCAPSGCCNSRLMTSIRSMCGLCPSFGRQVNCACCEVPIEKDHQKEDGGEYWLDQLDVKPRQLQELWKRESDERTMDDDTVRSVLHKNKLELADVWTNYHVDEQWESCNATQLLKVAKERATQLQDQARKRETYVQDQLADIDTQEKREAQQQLEEEEHEAQQQLEKANDMVAEVADLRGRKKQQLEEEEHEAQQQLEKANDMVAEVADLRGRQRLRLRIFNRKIANRNEDHPWWTRQKNQPEKRIAMKEALQARFKNEALTLLRRHRHQNLHRVLKDVERRHRETAREKRIITKKLEYFPNDEHWQRTVLLYLDDKAPWSVDDRNLLLDEFTVGMSRTSDNMRDEIDLNKFANQAEVAAGKILSWLRDQLRADDSESVGDKNEDDHDLGESMSVNSTATFTGGSISARDDSGTEQYPGTESADASWWKACSRCCLQLCSGSRLLLILIAFASCAGLAIVVFNKLGCCGRWLNGRSDGWPGQDGWDNITWQNKYHLSADSCYNANLQRGHQCTVSCMEGYVYSPGDIDVGRSNVFTCGGRFQQDQSSGNSVYVSEDDWWDNMFQPKWHFDSWIASGPWKDPDDAPNETDSRSWLSKIFTSDSSIRKKQAHPFCWKDPCYHPNRTLDPTHTSCGVNTVCLRVCEDLSSPSVESPGGVGGQPLCGHGKDEEGNGAQPYNYRYPTVANCSCAGDLYEQMDGAFASWPARDTGGCRRRNTLGAGHAVLASDLRSRPS